MNLEKEAHGNKMENRNQNIETCIIKLRNTVLLPMTIITGNKKKKKKIEIYSGIIDKW